MSGLYGSLPPAGTPGATEPVPAPPAGSQWTKSSMAPAQAVRKRPTPATSSQPTKPASSKKETPASGTASGADGKTTKESDSGNLINANQVADKYDPAFPNDYEEICKQRKRKQQRADNDELPQPAWQPRDEPAVDRGTQLSMSGDEAYRRRMEMSGMAPPAAHSSGPVSGPVLGEGESFAAKMMQQQGWKPGEGLGLKGQGITSALEHQKTGASSGKIVQAPVPQPAPQQPVPAPVRKKKSVKGRPSKVVLLRNMVGPGEVDDDLKGEVVEECSSYGEVEDVQVFEVKGDVAPEKAVRIFTKFLRQESAMKALVDLNGRFFGGRTIDVIFFSEARFDENDLSPTNDDFE